MTDLGDRLRASTKRAIEALVLVAEEPLTSHLLAQLLEVPPAVVDELCRELADGYDDDGRGFQMVRVAGGWRYQTHPDQAPYVERLVLEGQSGKLSAAALETLAIVAYKQPLSRAQVASIRGVSVDGVMRTLQQRGYIDEIGKDPGPGQAVLFGTTRLFLEKLGLNSLEELPPLRGFVPSADVVEQLEQGLRPDREPLRPEDAMARDDPLDDGELDEGGLSDGELTGASVPDDLSGFDEVLGIAPAADAAAAADDGRDEAPDVEGVEPGGSDDLDVVDLDGADVDHEDEEDHEGDGSP
jgi:segregation and condensation protein B